MMSGGHIYNYADIVVSNYDFNKIIDMQITRKLNEHAKLYLKGMVNYGIGDKYVEETNENSFIKISLKEEDGSSNSIFQGVITNISISVDNDVRMLEIEALSKTFLMDLKKKKRSFQNENQSYISIINSINSNNNASVNDNATNGAVIDKFLVQYEETDWEFIKRLASHFNAALIPECQLDNIKYSIGKSGYAASHSLDEFNYSINKELGEFRAKSGSGINGIDEMDLITYEIVTNKVLNLTDSVTFKGKNLYVYEAEIEMHNSVVSNKYKLRDGNGLKVNKIYNNKVVGASLKGTILDTKNDIVKVNLEIDGGENSGSRWFPYSTVFSSEDGSGWYCMPENGDAVRLYFPDNVEKNAYVISSVNLKSSNSQKRSDPSVKSLSTKYGKQLVMEPGAVSLIGGGGNLVKMTDDGGIQIVSGNKIVLDAQDDIEIKGKAKVSINGDSGVDLTQNSVKLSINDDVTMSGGKVKIE